MSSFNKVIIMGNLTRTPELRTTPGGTPVCDITLALNDKYKDGQGNWQERVNFVDVTCWGKTAELVCRWKKQGESLLIEGRLQQDKWVDKETGKNRSKLKVVASNMTFVGRGGGGDGGPRGNSAPQGSGNDEQNGSGESVGGGGQTDYATSLPSDQGQEPPF